MKAERYIVIHGTRYNRPEVQEWKSLTKKQRRIRRGHTDKMTGPRGGRYAQREAERNE